MGSIAKGILGGFSGKVGTVIGGTWKGIDFMRSRPSRTNRPATAKQLVQHAKFSLATKFVATMNKLLMVTFNNYAIEMTGTNSALSYLLKNAITGVYPNLAIDYASVLVSRGDLPNATNPIAAAAGGGIIKFTWTANVGVGIAKDTDKAVMVVYCNELKTSLYTYTGNTRKSELQNFDATIFTGKVVQTYIGFISEDGKEIASSIYTGELTVS